MRYIPHTPDDIRRMLTFIGCKDISDLFGSIPENLRLKTPLDLPDPLSEPELADLLRSLSDQNTGAGMTTFLGGGSYKHHVPAAIDQLLLRGEFFTAYTPYQPEISQGTLQAIFEYQTMITRFFGMEVANASMYDGASAVAESILMAARVVKKNKVFVSAALNPRYADVIRTYTQFQDLTMEVLPVGSDGRTAALNPKQRDTAAAILIQSPNFFGIIEDIGAHKVSLEGTDAIVITAFTEPLAYGILKTPGELGADIVAGEGSSFGIPTSFGGPALGIFATKKKYARLMPGRIAGETIDVDGKRGYVLTLSTREQHIRREKATSNICTNQALCALACTIYLTLHGKSGLPQLAKLNLDLASYAEKALVAAGAKSKYPTPHFNEFVLTLPLQTDKFVSMCEKEKIIPGFPLSGIAGHGPNDLLVTVTEVNTKEQIDRLASILKNR